MGTFRCATTARYQWRESEPRGSVPLPAVFDPLGNDGHTVQRYYTRFEVAASRFRRR